MATMVQWMVRVGLNLDLVALRAAKSAVEWGEEWLSLPQRWMELALAIAWLATETIGVLKWNGLMRGLGLAMVPLNLLWALARHRRPAAERKALIAEDSQIAVRVCILGLNLLGLLLSSLLRDLDVIDLSGVVLVLFIFVTALPQGADKLGRKRKVALAKLKEWFGSSWIPVPQGSGAQRVRSMQWLRGAGGGVGDDEGLAAETAADGSLQVHVVNVGGLQALMAVRTLAAEVHLLDQAAALCVGHLAHSIACSGTPSARRTRHEMRVSA